MYKNKVEYLKSIKHTYGRNCRDCKGPNQGYMVDFKLWNTHAGDGVNSKFIRNQKGSFEIVEGTGNFVCVSCFEKRLGRDLAVEDFTTAPINFELFGFDCRIYCSLTGEV